MSQTTKEKLQLLRAYTLKNFPLWRKKYSTNIVGAHVGKKRVKGKERRVFSIVFHVAVKHEPEIKLRIPKTLRIRLPGKRGFVDVPTDVIETGSFRHHDAQPGNTLQHKGDGGLGTLGFIAVRQTVPPTYYFCTCAHVIAPDLLSQGHVVIPPPQRVIDVKSFSNGGPFYARLEAMVYDRYAIPNHGEYGIDAAIARIDPQGIPVSKEVTHLGFPYTNATRLPDDLFLDKGVILYGAETKVHKGYIAMVDAVKPSPAVPGLTMTNLLAIEMTQQDLPPDHGDSGGPVLMQGNYLLGIYIGRDSKYSYVVPAAAIMHAFNIQPL